MGEELKKLEELLANDRKIIEENYKEIERLTKVEQEHQILNGMLRKENDRLNNIINELEKWLNEKICLNKNDKDYINSMTFVGVNLQMYQMFLDKLQELKGSDKE